MNTNDVPHEDAEGQGEERPTLALVFMSDPSKYMVQSSAWTCAGGS